MCGGGGGAGDVCVYGIGSCDYGCWQVQNLHGEPAGRRSREEPTLQFESVGCLLVDFLPVQKRSVFCSVQAIS